MRFSSHRALQLGASSSGPAVTASHCRPVCRHAPNMRLRAVDSDQAQQSQTEFEHELRARSGEQASAPPPRPFPFDVADSEAKKRQKTKTNILMEIMTAGETVEDVIAKHSAELDEEMLDILDKRSRVAARMKEGDQAVAGLKLIYRRLASEVERNKASPTQRLLNELLEVMMPFEGISPQEQEEEVERVLRQAFEPPAMPHIDIFATAARIAQGEEVEVPEPDMTGRVPRHEFVYETEKVLQDGIHHAQALKRRIEKGHVNKHEAAYIFTLERRAEALQSINKILEIAKNLY